MYKLTINVMGHFRIKKLMIFVAITLFYLTRIQGMENYQNIGKIEEIEDEQDVEILEYAIKMLNETKDKIDATEEKINAMMDNNLDYEALVKAMEQQDEAMTQRVFLLKEKTEYEWMITENLQKLNSNSANALWIKMLNATKDQINATENKINAMIEKNFENDTYRHEPFVKAEALVKAITQRENLLRTKTNYEFLITVNSELKKLNPFLKRYPEFVKECMIPPKVVTLSFLDECTTDQDELVQALLKYKVLNYSASLDERFLKVILQFLEDGPKEKLLLEHKSGNLNYVVEQFAEKGYLKMQVLVQSKNVNQKILTKCMEEITDLGNGLHVLFAGVEDDYDLKWILNVFLDHPESLLYCLNMKNTNYLTPYHYIGFDALKAKKSVDVQRMYRFVNDRKSSAGKMLDDKEFLNHLKVRSLLEKNFEQLEKKYYKFAALVFGQKNRKDGREHKIDTKRGNKPHLKKKIGEYIYHENEYGGINEDKEEEEKNPKTDILNRF